MDKVKGLETTLDLYLRQKAPALPANVRKLLVDFAPWITVILIVLGLPALLAVLGISLYITPFAYWAGVRVGFLYWLSIALLAATLLIRALALPGLFSRSRSAWKLLYYSVFLDLGYSLFSYAIVGGIVGTLISLYLLFQVKEYYK